jgi:two-component system CheB/CheR fusion protein
MSAKRRAKKAAGAPKQADSRKTKSAKTVSTTSGRGKGKAALPFQRAVRPAKSSSGTSVASPPAADTDEDLAPEGQPVDGPPIAGLVASAGGLEAFKKFFTAMPDKSGLGFVLVPHLDPKHQSLMAELIARHTAMPVIEAADGMHVEANHVYVIPPNNYMTIKRGSLRLTGPVDPGTSQMSIDLFLRALADDRQEKAVCIVLSGTGAHGTLGLKAIKAAGGMAMVQDPATAGYPRMPESAIATGLADYVLPAEQMPQALMQFVHQFYFGGGKVVKEADAAPEHLNQVLALLRTRTRFDFRGYRKKMLSRRVERRMGLTRSPRIADYLAYLRDHPDEVKRLARDFLISVTSFFRDPDAYDALEKQAMIPLLEAHEDDAPLRVWVCGCATGEEAYSVAMLLIEQLTAAQKSCRLQIFATDVDDAALETARLGIYTEAISADVSPERLARFFTRIDDSTYQINSQVRESIVFAAQNVITDPPFSKLDLITCRNLLIYLETDVQKKVVSLLHFALNAGGYLFLGPSETIGRQTDLFEAASKKWRTYRRIGPNRPGRHEFPLPAAGEHHAPLRRLPGSGPGREESFAALTQRLLLDELEPAAVLINRRYEILYYSGPTTRYLDMPTGEPTQDLNLMIREGLRSKLRGAIHQALQDGQPVHVHDAQVKRNSGYVPIEVAVKPVRTAAASNGLLLIIFRDVLGSTQPPAETKQANEDPVVRQLEMELHAMKEDLRGTTEEMESSNEELKASNEEVMSMNEELQSANEELETSKEELQSLNEELTTVNNQLQDKVQDLETANNDMANLLNCTDIPTVFLDKRLCIRQFTAATTQLLNLIATDVGRPLSDITAKFNDAKLISDAKDVLRRLTPQSQEVRSEDERWWIRRVVPYRTLEDAIEGVVITFTEVTQLKRNAESARLLATVLQNSDDTITIEDFSGRITAWNRGAERMLGYTEAEALGMNITDLIPDVHREERMAIARRLERGERVDSWESRRITKDGRLLEVWIAAKALTDESGRPIAIAKTARDITELKKARTHLEQEVERRTAELREQQDRLRALHEAAADAIVTFDDQGRVESFNRAAEHMFGYSAAEMHGREVAALLSSPDLGTNDGDLAQYAGTGEPGDRIEHPEAVACRKDGSTFPVDLAISKVGNSNVFIAIIRDISQRKLLEREIVAISTLEQMRIGQNLHDDCGQDLTALGLLTESLETAIGRADSPQSDITGKIKTTAQRLMQRVREISRGLAQVEIDAGQLPAALTEMASRLGAASRVECIFQGDGAVRLADNGQATQLYHIAQEACTNAIKHANARQVAIRLRSDEGAVILEIQDDGRGIRKAHSEGLGMRIMRNRASVLGAQLTVARATPRGTIVTCVLSKGFSHVAGHAQGTSRKGSDRRRTSRRS